VSCPNEFTWSVYVDGELPSDEVRTAEMHLVSCRECRTQVMALRDEVAALSDAFYERAPAPVLLRSHAAPTRELAWSLPAAVAAVTGLLAIVGLLLELRLPGVLDLLNPRRLMGVYEMAFDSVFMLRNRLPAIFDLAASVGAVASVSALGCAAVHALSRRFTRPSLPGLALILLLGAPEAARAIDLRMDQDTHIGAGETVAETLVCTGDVITIDGTIDGDLVLGAERVVMRGTVTGNLYVFGSEVEIDGVVLGSVLAVGERVRLGGRVEGAVTLGGERITIADGARVERDVALFGDGARMEGVAARDVAFAGEWIEVRGEIARDLHVLGADEVRLLDSARVGRNVRAHLWGRNDQVEQAAGATVGGELQVVQESVIREHYLALYQDQGFYMMLLVGAAAAFVFGLLIYLLDPRLFAADPPDARGFFRSLGSGFVVLLAGPVALVLVGLTVVGVPVAVLGVFILLSAIYTSYVIVAGMVGHAVLVPSGPGLGAFAPTLLVGVLILSAIAALPFVGPPVRIVAVLFGLGCLLERLRGLHALNLRGIRA
jgi:anti-sigma factor RsiW/cytoskeletal protein CcmA (bactofilin family)